MTSPRPSRPSNARSTSWFETETTVAEPAEPGTRPGGADGPYRRPVTSAERERRYLASADKLTALHERLIQQVAELRTGDHVGLNLSLPLSLPLSTAIGTRGP